MLLKAVAFALVAAALPSELALRAQLLATQERLVQAQVAAAACQMTADRQGLEAEVRRVFGADASIDWTTAPPSLKPGKD